MIGNEYSVAVEVSSDARKGTNSHDSFYADTTPFAFSTLGFANLLD